VHGLARYMIMINVRERYTIMIIVRDMIMNCHTYASTSVHVLVRDMIMNCKVCA
jgi:hypothetical protein